MVKVAADANNEDEEVALSHAVVSDDANFNTQGHP